MKFYHVIPKNLPELKLERLKEEDEIIGEENIKKKIESLNLILRNKDNKTAKDIFYILETPIKNINNDSLLKECYFMDIPGLNEYNNPYIDIIFSFITLEYIKFEIMIFDSTSIDSDKNRRIIENLQQKNGLKKGGNLLILNKIDKVTSQGKEDNIEHFRFVFYKNFEDHKRKSDDEENKLFLNINDNFFIPMNSILYEAETKYNIDFYSMLVVEYFMFLENKEAINSFKEFLKLRIEIITNCYYENLKIDINTLKEKDIKIIIEAVKEVKILSSGRPKIFDIDIKENNSNEEEDVDDDSFGRRAKTGKDKEKKKTENIIKELYYLYKNNEVKILNHSMFYDKINEFFTHKINNNLSSAPSPIIEINNSQNEECPEIINEFGTFLNKALKEIDKDNELEIFKNAFIDLKEDITGKKVRIAFIGNISVGKSSILNTIIGKRLLPTKDGECTYRGVILRYEDCDEFKLYNTKLIERGEGFDEYYYFQKSEKPYCVGIEDIQNHLGVKNNDENMDDEDAYILITGKLKIFEHINIDESLRKKIEFIDLPGADKKENIFNKKYHDKILRFSNCCIFVNEANTTLDQNSVEKMIQSYRSHKDKIFPTLRNEFIRTCLFLMNKSDELEKKKDIAQEKMKNLDEIFKHIIDSKDRNNLEKKKDLIICYFSGKYYMEYLEAKEMYVSLLEKNPYESLNKLLNEYNKESILTKNFYGYINDKIIKINNDFGLNVNDLMKTIEVPKDFINKLKASFNELEIESNIENEKIIIKKLYILKRELTTKNFSHSLKYSNHLYDKLEKVIKNSQQLRQKNLKLTIEEYLIYADLLFDKKIIEDKKENKEAKKKKYEDFEIIANKIKEIFVESHLNYKKNLEEGIDEILKLFDDEIKNSFERLKESNNDIDLAKTKLEQKIQKLLKAKEDKGKEEIANLNTKINNLRKEHELKIEEFKENQSKISNANLDLSFQSFISNLLVKISDSIEKIGSGAKSAIQTLVKTLVGDSIQGILISTGIVFGIDLIISLASSIFSYFKEKKYKNALEEYKNQMEKDLKDFLKNRESDFKTYYGQINKEINIRKVIYKTDINSKDITETIWEKTKIEYQALRLQFMEEFELFQK